MSSRTRSAPLAVAVLLTLSMLVAGPAAGQVPGAVLNEFVANHTGSDTCEYVEVAGPGNADLSGLTVLQLEGDTSRGTIDSATPVGTTNAAGYWESGFLANVIENGTITLLLVEGFTGTVGQDLDTNDDGTLDATPWTAIVDDVAVNDGGAGDLTYATTVLTAAMDGGAFPPGGASRLPDRIDTDAVSDWTRNDFDGAGIPCGSGSPEAGEALNTPGAANAPAVASGGADLVVNEIDYDQPGTDAAEFIELRNNTAAPIDLDPYQVELVNGNGAVVYNTIDLPAVSLAAGDHYVICANAATVANCDLDVSPDTNLIQNGAPDAVAITLGGVIVDTVSYEGDTAGYTEGTGATGDSGSLDAVSLSRVPDGQDTDDNSADLRLACSTPGATNAFTADNCVTAAVVLIHEVQGPGFVSPLVNQLVTVEAVVTGYDDEVGRSFSGFVFPEDRGIWIQEEPAQVDADPATSEGVFVGIDVFPPNYDILTLYPRDTVVEVTGRVEEKFGQTIISVDDLADITVIGPASDVPTPVVIDETLANAQAVDPNDPSASRPYYESLEGMLVTLPVGVANSGGTNKFGELFLTPGTTQDRVFRDEDPPGLIATDDDAGSGNPANPLKRPIDSSTRVEADLFDTVRNATGPLSFTFSNFKIMVQEGGEPTVEDTGVPFPFELPFSAGEHETAVAAFNLENYFPVGAELDLEPVTPAEFAEKTDRLADAIGNLLEAPAIVGVQEVHYPETVIDQGPGQTSALDALAARINTEFGTAYEAYVATSNDSRDIAVGYLVDLDRVAVTEVEQYDPAGACSDTPGKLFDRPPLRISVEVGAAAFDLIVNHWASKGSDPDGSCRVPQSAFVEGVVDGLEAAGREVIVLGDLNAFEDEAEVTNLEDGPTTLDNLWDQVDAELRYSFQFQGKLQTLDHILVTSGLQPLVRDVTYAHFDNDYYLRFDQPADGHSESDHDPPVALLYTGPTCNGLPATIIGTDGRDLLFGTDEDDVIVGLGDRDVIHAGRGNDVVCGGEGDDVIVAGAGDDLVLAEAGDDIVNGGQGTDTVDGGDGRDVCVNAELVTNCELPRSARHS